MHLTEATSFWNPRGTPNLPGRGMPKKLTDLFVKKVQGGPQRAEYRDGHTRGLMLRVTPNGNKTWAVLYRRKSDARKRRYTIGAYPAFSLNEARDRAQEALAAVARGEDPAAQVQRRNASPPFSKWRTPGSIDMGAPTRPRAPSMTISSC